MNIFSYDPLNRRLWICNRRIHHGLVGIVMAALGTALAFEDRHDFPWLPVKDR